MATSAPDDGALVARALDRDHEAFAVLFRRHGPGVHAFAQRRTRSPELADDVTATSFEHAWTSLNQLGRQHGDRFRPWVFRIAANEMASLMRTASRRRDRDHLAAVRGTVDHDQSTTAGGLTTVEASIEAAPVLAAMSELSERHQAVLTLRFLSDLSPAETADALSVTTGNVAVLTHRAIAALRRQLDSEELR